MPRLLGFLRKLSHFLKNSEIAGFLSFAHAKKRFAANLNHYHCSVVTKVFSVNLLQRWLDVSVMACEDFEAAVKILYL